MKNIVIYGGGPTGMTIAYYLSTKYNITLIEKDNSLGGCWKCKYVDNKYFSEHAPRVMGHNNSKFFEILKDIGADNFNNIYGNILTTTIKLSWFFLKNINILDYIKLVFGIIYYDLSKYTVYEFCNNINLSDHTKKTLYYFSILLANSPKKLIVKEILDESIESFPTKFVQFKDPMEWIILLEKELIKRKVKIIKNAQLNKFMVDNNNISYSIVNHNIIKGDYHILAIPPNSLYKLLKNQDDVIKNNFMKYNKFLKWNRESHYSSFSFQFHFKKKINYNKPFGYPFYNDYNVIILPISNYVEKYTKDKNIKFVLSCCIVDMEMVIKKYNKKIKDLSKKTIIDDILEIIDMKPDKITFYESDDNAFSLSKYGVMKEKGNINNFYTVGSHNKKGITTINKSVDIAYNFCFNNFLN